MPKPLTLCPTATWTVRKSNPVNTANINQMPPLFWQGRHFIFGASPHNSRLTAQAPLRRLRHGICVAKMLDNVGLRYPHRASGAKAPRTLRPLPLLLFAVSATGGAHLCSIQYYLRFWLSSCRTSLAVSALRIMRYCPMKNKKALAAGLCGANYPWCIQKTHICWFEREKPVCHSFVSALERCAFLPALPGLCCR